MESTCYCTTLRDAARRTTAKYDEALKPIGIGVAQFGLLRKLARSGPTTMTVLGRLADLDRSTIGRNVRVLERMELVLLERGEVDQRETMVSLTPEGVRAVEEGDRLWQGAQDLIEARFGTEAARTLIELLHEL